MCGVTGLVLHSVLLDIYISKYPASLLDLDNFVNMYSNFLWPKIVPLSCCNITHFSALSAAYQQQKYMQPQSVTLWFTFPYSHLLFSPGKQDHKIGQHRKWALTTHPMLIQFDIRPIYLCAFYTCTCPNAFKMLKLYLPPAPARATSSRLWWAGPCDLILPIFTFLPTHLNLCPLVLNLHHPEIKF